ncbi:hypothetical protein [Kitasatospora purpeofusca]|uniref:Cobalamin biosynthesis protein CbiM n=1 Tax=Kitasatospora purpeofusca TaxID=67352 RepID=A0ABZ1TT82_9ACTN|nr:hypothetical protein [Kitasatospora purpeofusca]
MLIPLVLLVAGVGLVLMGVNKLNTAEPTCYGRPMSPGDICHVQVKGSFGEGMPEPHDTTYQEQLDSLTSGGWTAIGFGAVLLALAVVITISWTVTAARQDRDH